MRKITVTVTVDDRRVTLEGPADFVRSEVGRITGMSGPSGSGQRASGRPSGDGLANLQSESNLIRQKQPRGHPQTVAVLAYFLRESGVPEFTADDIRRAYLRARIRPPKVVAQALRDAKNRFDFIERGSERGMFRLSPHGERTVLFDLPSEKTTSGQRGGE